MGPRTPERAAGCWSAADTLYLQARLEGSAGAPGWVRGAYGTACAHAVHVRSCNASVNHADWSKNAPTLPRQEVEWESHLQHSHLLAMMERDAEEQERLVPAIGMMLDESLNQPVDAVTEGAKGQEPPRCQSTFSRSFEEGLHQGDVISGLRMTGSAFLRLLMSRGCCSASAIVVGVIYLERLRYRDESLVLTARNFKRLLLVSVMVAAKFLEDRCSCNRQWADMGSISLDELNRLEVEFLCQIGFSLNITREEYEWYAEELRLRSKDRQADVWIQQPVPRNDADMGINTHEATAVRCHYPGIRTYDFMPNESSDSFSSAHRSGVLRAAASMTAVADNEERIENHGLLQGEDQEEGAEKLPRGEQNASSGSELSLSALLKDQLVQLERVFAALGSYELEDIKRGETEKTLSVAKDDVEGVHALAQSELVSTCGRSCTLVVGVEEEYEDTVSSGPLSDQSMDGRLSAQDTPSAGGASCGDWSGDNLLPCQALDLEQDKDDYQANGDTAGQSDLEEEEASPAENQVSNADTDTAHEGGNASLEEFLESIRQSLLQSEMRLDALHQSRCASVSRRGVKSEGCGSSGRCQSLQTLSSSNSAAPWAVGDEAEIFHIDKGQQGDAVMIANSKNQVYMPHVLSKENNSEADHTGARSWRAAVEVDKGRGACSDKDSFLEFVTCIGSSTSPTTEFALSSPSWLGAAGGGGEGGRGWGEGRRCRQPAGPPLDPSLNFPPEAPCEAAGSTSPLQAWCSVSDSRSFSPCLHAGPYGCSRGRLRSAPIECVL